MEYQSVIIVVDDVLKSRKFYEDMFNQKVDSDFGQYNVGFKSGLALYQREMFNGMTNLQTEAQPVHTSVLYFEDKDMEGLQKKLEPFTAENSSYKIKFLHKIKEAPWGQYIIRLFDADGHLIEIGEDMNVCIHRMQDSGMNAESIAQKTGFDLPRVKDILAKPLE